MTLRKVLFWCHLTVGLVAGAVIFVMAVTGALLAFEKQVTRWADGYRIDPAPGAVRLPVGELLERAGTERGEGPTSVSIRADSGAPVEVGLGRERTLFLDPYTGAVLGEGSRAVRRFFHVVTDWHRWLGAHGESRATGRAVTGASNLAFLFIVLSGPLLWWPRKWEWRQLRPVVLPASGLRGRARDFNWHNVCGLWTCVPLAFVVASAVFISYPWANDLLYRAFGEEPPPRRGAGATGPRRDGSRRDRGRPPAEPGFEGLARGWAVAEAQVPAWQTISLRLPTEHGAPLTFSIDTSSCVVRPDRRAQLTVDPSSGAVVRFQPYSGQSPARRVRAWARWVHTGEAFGLAGQAVAGLASLAAVLLAYTGLALSLRRFRAWIGRRARTPEPAPADARAASQPLYETSFRSDQP